MKVVVVQTGARHHYAVPRMLEAAGVLAALYTGPCASKGLGRWLDLFCPARLRRGALNALIQRKVTGVPSSKIKTVDRLAFHRTNPKAGYAEKNTIYKKQDELFTRGLMPERFSGADMAYFMLGEGMGLLTRAKSLGLKTLVDVTVTPRAHRVIVEERLRFPGWEEDLALTRETLEAIESNVSNQLALADLLLCPGPNVVDGLQHFANFRKESIRIVPYGTRFTASGRRNRPVPGRIVFPGTAELRKGIHIFAQAANLLKENGRGYQLRVAGGASDRIRNRPECRNLHFLGRLPREAMMEEFLCADAVVLPTLAEGMPSVINEALALGAPVITTAASGALITHEKDGLIVPERNAPELAKTIERLVSDRPFRERLTEAGLALAADASEERWAQRLMAALTELEAQTA